MNVPYAFWPLSLAILYFYIVSALLVKSGFLAKSYHIRIWNYILLIIFLPLIFTGIFLALQINYKWDIQTGEKILNWHVNAGIAFSITGIIHLFRHIRYYYSLEKRRPERSASSAYEYSGYSPVKLFLLGFITLTSQIIIIRTGLHLFEGNELTIGMILGIWMLFTALGAFSGRKEPEQKTGRWISGNGLFFLSILTVLTYLAIIIIKYLFYPPGVNAGLGGTLLIFSIVLLPFCFFSGILFLHLSREIKSSKESGFTYSYFLESSGSLLAGLFTSFVSIYFLDLFQTAVLLIIITLSSQIFDRNISQTVRNFRAFLLFIAIVLFVLPIENQLARLLYPGQEIIVNSHDPYGNTIVTKTDEQLNIFSNNQLLFSYDDLVIAEETAHLPLSQINNPDAVLQISGGHTGSLSKILAHDPSGIDYVETDPGLVRILKDHTDHLNDNRINVISSVDAIRFIEKSNEKYDVIIVATPPPTNLALSRYYSLGFFNTAKENLTDRGVLSISLPTAADYSTENAIKLNSALYNTLMKVFTNVMIISGTNNYFLASDKELSIDIPGLMKTRNIETEYVNEYYLDIDELRMRSDLLESEIDHNQPVITMDKPTAFFYSISYWAGKYNINLRVVILITFIILLLILLPNAGNAINLNMFLAGFCSAGFEIILLFRLQAGLGNLYQYSALIIALFMTGLAIGSYPMKSFRPKKFWIILIFTCLLSLTGIIINLEIFSFWGKPLLLILYISIITLLVSAFSGAIFRFSSEWKNRINANSEEDLYSSDLSGGAFGSLIAALIFIPFAGISGAAYLLSGLLGISALVLLIYKVKMKL